MNKLIDEVLWKCIGRRASFYWSQSENFFLKKVKIDLS